MTFYRKAISRVPRLVVMILVTSALAITTGCYPKLANDASVSGQLKFHRENGVVVVEPNDCRVDFFEREDASYVLLVECEDIGYVAWWWPQRQEEFDEMFSEGEIADFDKIYGQVEICESDNINCEPGLIICEQPRYLDGEGYSQLKRYSVEQDDIVDKGIAFNAHGLFEFNMPDCVEGFVEVKVNVR